MTPQEALQLVDGVLARVSGTREDHAKIVEAVGVLAAAIAPPEEP